MTPVAPTELVSTGIVVFSKALERYPYQKIQIFYNKVNPKFDWGFCKNELSLLWEDTTNRASSDTLFVYNSPTTLSKGFYNIVITAYSSFGDSKKGELTIGLVNTKNTLYIGLPYSSYNSIPLT